jgi:uncharacterized protein (TIGR02466 family)
MTIFLDEENKNKKEFFQTPIYDYYKPEWVDEVNGVCDRVLDEIKASHYKKILDERYLRLGDKNFEKVKDHGLSYHSGSLVGLPGLDELTKFIGKTSWNILSEQGFDVSNYTMMMTEYWVQQFAENGGGHHDTHIHYDNHISGFYFLKCSSLTSNPIFHDPRPAALMSKLPLKDPNKLCLGQSSVNVQVKPGTLIFFNAYLPHQFTVDDGIEPFRFIHFNIQAIRSGMLSPDLKDMRA